MIYEFAMVTFNLNKAVKRNADRFPEDFMFQLSKEEFENLTFQFGISRWGGRRYRPYAFTEHGVAMLSSVLNSKRAMQMNIVIIRAFVKLREVLTSHKHLARKIEEIEATQKEHASVIVAVVKEIRQLKRGPRQRKLRIGFVTDEERK